MPELPPVTMATRSFSLMGIPFPAAGSGGELTPAPGGRQSGRWAAVLLVLLLAAAGEAAASASGEEALAGEIEATRALKDSLFRHGPESPLRPEDVSGFGGLRYFPVDPAWRIPGEFHRYGRVRRLPMPDSAGATTVVQRIGRFLFEHGGRSYRLEVYGSDQDSGLSVFFTDETNRVQTYGAGRYVPVAADEAGTWVLDFNRAYNPFCAYNPEYICPLPPEQNRLPFAVRAGELNPGPDLASPDLAK